MVLNILIIFCKDFNILIKYLKTSTAIKLELRYTYSYINEWMKSCVPLNCSQDWQNGRKHANRLEVCEIGNSYRIIYRWNKMIETKVTDRTVILELHSKYCDSAQRWTQFEWQA